MALELEERRRVILGLLGEKKIEELRTGSGNVWLVFRTLDEIASDFYASGADYA